MASSTMISRNVVAARACAGSVPRRVPVALRTPAEAARRVDDRRQLPAHIVRRRRLVAVALGVLVLACAVLLAARVGKADAELQGPPPPAPVYVVRPGDTLWSIAARLDPGGDPRPLVEQLAEAAGGAELVPGQRIELPRSLG
ncbi:MAG TPA: LysM domain-containing protein [Acidimicrobiales bacterium]